MIIIKTIYFSVLFNNVVEVACTFEKIKIDYVDNQFKLLNIVVLVALNN